MPIIDYSLYPQWLADIYTVVYDGNGNNSGSVPVDTTEYNYEHTVTVQSNPGGLVAHDSMFLGWNTIANGSGTNYIGGDTFLITSDTTMYAQWRPTYGRGYVSKFSVIAESFSGTSSDKPYEYKTWRQPTIIG